MAERDTLAVDVEGSTPSSPLLISEEDNCGFCGAKPLVIINGKYCKKCTIIVPEFVLARCVDANAKR